MDQRIFLVGITGLPECFILLFLYTFVEILRHVS